MAGGRRYGSAARNGVRRCGDWDTGNRSRYGESDSYCARGRGRGGGLAFSSGQSLSHLHDQLGEAQP